MPNLPPKPRTKGLGKGLSALIDEINDVDLTVPGSIPDTVTSSLVQPLPLDLLDPSRFQPRKYFAEEEIRELAESIKHNGVMQPIVVRRGKSGRYEIIAGERRWRACKLAQVEYIPAIVRVLNDEQAMEFALIENIQRENLTPLEEAEGYRRILEECKYTQEKLAETIGKSRSHLANMLRLLSLPLDVQQLLEQGELTAGHARALVGLENASVLAKEIAAKKLNVRQTENLIKNQNRPSSPSSAPKPKPTSFIPRRPSAPKDEDIIALEQSVSSTLGLQVNIDDSDEGGLVTIHFSNLEQLDMILKKLGGGI